MPGNAAGGLYYKRWYHFAAWYVDSLQANLKKISWLSPALVVEILSPATAAKDRVYKYYIIIDPDKIEAEVYELNNGEYKMTAKGKDFNQSFLLDECTAEIDFKEIWK